MDESEDDSDCSVRSDRPTQFRLNGKSWDFENPVTLVLAAARQLGMAIGRDVNLLWIADEALLDEFDEGEADERLGDAVPAAPLSEEVASHYTSLYEARSRTTFVRQAAGAHPPLPSPAGRRGGRASRAERARRRLALREARLSNISERSREDSSGTEAYSESASSPEGGRSDEPWMPSGRAAPAREGTTAGLARALPRIDSASLQLDLLDSEAAKAEPAGGEGASEAEGQIEGRLEGKLEEQSEGQSEGQSDGSAGRGCGPAGESQPLSAHLGSSRRRFRRCGPAGEREGGRRGGAGEGAAAGAGGGAAGEAAGVGAEAAAAEVGDAPFAVGAAVEVDFDDEGWFEGTVVGVGRGGRGFVYRVAPSPPGEEGRDRGAGVAVSSTLLLL